MEEHRIVAEVVAEERRIVEAGRALVALAPNKALVRDRTSARAVADLGTIGMKEVLVLSSQLETSARLRFESLGVEPYRWLDW